MAIEKVFGNQEVYRCEKCGHTWMKRGEERPLIVPNVKLPDGISQRKRVNFFESNNSRLRYNARVPKGLCVILYHQVSWKLKQKSGSGEIHQQSVYRAMLLKRASSRKMTNLWWK